MITIKRETITSELETLTTVCPEHGELVYTQSSRVAAKEAMRHRDKYPTCGPIKNAADQ